VKGLKLENINPQIPSFRKHFDSPEVLVECAQLTIVLDVREVFACFEILQITFVQTLNPLHLSSRKIYTFCLACFSLLNLNRGLLFSLDPLHYRLDYRL
jgi:hypothetical protein